MIKIVVAGAENNAVFQNLRNEKNKLSRKTDTFAGGPPVKGLRPLNRHFRDDRNAAEKFRSGIFGCLAGNAFTN
jgi:hypothetical protein